MSVKDIIKNLIYRMVKNQLHSPKTCKGCKYLVYNKDGGHWCTFFAENCSNDHRPLDDRCYERDPKNADNSY